jgi:hypothetical protein
MQHSAMARPSVLLRSLPSLVSMLALGAACSGACSAKKGLTGSHVSGDECDPDAGAGGASLLTNGSFEQPPVPAGGFSVVSNGETTLAGWTVIGDAGNVAPLSTTFLSAGFAFTAEDGQQSVDMTGTSQTATGLQQISATTPGHTYCLSFWVGNIFNPGGAYGIDSTINVLVDGKLVTVATNADQDPSALSWQRFTSTVVAAGTSTSIAFVNADPPTDSSNFLDDVVLR